MSKKYRVLKTPVEKDENTTEEYVVIRRNGQIVAGFFPSELDDAIKGTERRLKALKKYKNGEIK